MSFVPHPLKAYDFSLFRHPSGLVVILGEHSKAFFFDLGQAVRIKNAIFD
jgi:hypothetical protein